VIVEVHEQGSRPAIMTKARRFAPQAMHAMAKYLQTRGFAGKVFLVLDWSNVTGQLPADAIKPILYVQAVRDVPGKGQLRVEQKFDVDEIFSQEFMTPTILVDLCHELEEAVEKAVKEKK
jgi:hypothetical protein